MEEREETAPKEIAHLMQSAQSAPNIYSNGFSIGLGTGDITIILTLGGGTVSQTVGKLNMSYTLAKTLSIKLMGVIQTLESKTGTSIMTTDHINKSLFGVEEGGEK